MKFSLRKTIQWVLILVSLITAGMFLWQKASTAAGEALYDEAARLAFSGEEQVDVEAPPAPAGTWVPAPVEDDPYMAELADIDLDALREINPDVVGWIMIPGGKINYPIMKGEDNDEYLRRAWNGKRNYVGSIFVEELNSPDMTDYHTILYGHNMNNGDMFGELRNYNNGTYRKQHPYIYIVTDSGVYRYEVFSIHRADVDSDTYRVSFTQAKERADFLIRALKKDMGSYGIFPDANDRVLTLSTCTTGGYSQRYVVQARLPMIKTAEDVPAETN